MPCPGCTGKSEKEVRPYLCQDYSLIHWPLEHDQVTYVIFNFLAVVLKVKTSEINSNNIFNPIYQKTLSFQHVMSIKQC